MANSKLQVQASGVALAELAKASADGFSLAEDSDEIMALVASLPEAFNEFTGDPKVALMYLFSAALEHYADLEADETWEVVE